MIVKTSPKVHCELYNYLKYSLAGDRVSLQSLSDSRVWARGSEELYSGTWTRQHCVTVYLDTVSWADYTLYRRLTNSPGSVSFCATHLTAQNSVFHSCVQSWHGTEIFIENSTNIFYLQH